MKLWIMFIAVGGDAHHTSLHRLEEKVRHWQNQATKSARDNLNTTHQDNICFKLFIFTAFMQWEQLMKSPI